MLRDLPPLVTLDEFVDTFKDPDHIAAADSIATLEEDGLLPLNLGSDEFFGVSALAVSAFWSGTLGYNSRGLPFCELTLDSYQSRELEKDLWMLDAHLELARGTSAFKIGPDPFAYARLLTLIPGSFVSFGGSQQDRAKKSSQEASMPDYVDFLVAHGASLPRSEALRAQGLLYEAARIIVDKKLRILDTRGIPYGQLSLHAKRAEEHIEPLARQTIEVLNAAHPDLGLTMRDVRVYYHGTKQVFESHVSFSYRQTQLMMERHNPRLA